MRFKGSMKYALIAILLVAGANSYGQKADAKKSFAKHFKILDSFALLTNTDTVYEIRCVMQSASPHNKSHHNP